MQWEGWEQHEVRGFATEHAEIMAHSARVESASAARSLERKLDAQAVADNVEKRCQRQHAASLAAAQSRIGLIQHACWSYQLQLNDAEDTLKEFETDALRALDSLAGQARAREDELQKRHQSWLSVKEGRMIGLIFTAATLTCNTSISLIDKLGEHSF